MTESNMNPHPIPRTTQLRQLNGRHQLIINSPERLKQVLTLSPVHWTANIAPIDGLSCNRTFLTYLDSDNNGKIMPKEVIESIEWMMDRLTNLQGCVDNSDSIPLDNFRIDTQSGTQLKSTAELILQNLDKNQVNSIALKDVKERTRIVQVGATNGDGILPPSVLDGNEKRFVEACLQIFEAPVDITGEKGVDASMIQKFNSGFTAWSAWQSSNPHPDFTEAMSSIIEAIKPIIERHFVWVQYPDLESSGPQLTNKPNPSLQSTDWIHPTYRVMWKELWSVALSPLSIETLTNATWEQVWWMNHAHHLWIQRRPVGSFEKVESERLEEMFSQVNIQNSLLAKIEQDTAVSTQLQRLSSLEKTLLFQQNLCTFLNSFINFSNFYNPQHRSMPEIGSLLLDGRWFRLVVHVPNREKHIKQAKNSGFFLLYLSVTLADKQIDIAAAVTGHERGELHIGKKGVFYDIHNEQHPAEIVHIIDNPININEALWKPVEKLQTLAKTRLENFSKEQETKLETGIKEDQKNTAQWMNGGVTLAALSSSFAYLIKTLTSVKITSIALVIMGPLIILAIFSSLIAGWKLHRRDLGPILEASGWGINHPLRVPEWAAEVFTLNAIVPKTNESNQQDLLTVFEHTADPNRFRTRLVMWLCFCILGYILWWNWTELITFLQNLESLKSS